MDTDDHQIGPPERALTVADLDRERLVAYLDWAQAPTPSWWIPAYGLAVGAWIASQGLGSGWRAVGSVVLIGVMLMLLRVITASTGVSLPRFRGMPTPLKRTYAAPAGALIGVVVAWGVLALGPGKPPYLLLGTVAGLLFVASLLWQGHRCRVVARRLAAEAGLQR